MLSLYYLNTTRLGIGAGPRIAQVEIGGPLVDEVIQGRNLMRPGDTVMDVLVETDAQLPGRGGQGHKSIPGGRAVRGAGAKADGAFAHTLTRAQLGGVIVQRDLYLFSILR